MDKFADKLVEYLNGADVFLKTQLPDFVNQFVVYETWHAHWIFGVWIGAATVFAILMLISFIWAATCYDPPFPCFLGIIAGVVCIASTFGSLDAYSDLRQLEMAPKVYMARAAAQILKPGCSK